MSHLDEGMIHALLDGEIPSAELPPIQAHLGACAECRARLAEEQELLATSDRLIELIEVPAAGKPIAAKGSSTQRRTWPRAVAWAATVVLAAGLGYSAREAGPDSTETKVPAAETVFVEAKRPTALAEEPPARLEGARDAVQPGPASPQAGATGRLDERAKPATPDKARAREAQEGRVAADSPATTKSAVGANVAAAAPPVPKVESLPAPPAAPVSVSQLNSARRLGATPMRLEEIVVASADARSAKLTAPSLITFPEAVRKLGGSLRLIDGLIPERLETLGPAVRVVYLTGFGELVLSQELTDGAVRHTLIAPRGFPADSLERLRARVRE